MCISVCSATLVASGPPILGHASHSGPQLSVGFLPGLYYLQIIDPTKGMRSGMHVVPSFFMRVLKGITGCLCQPAVASQWISLFGPLANKADPLQRELWAPASWPNRQSYTSPRLCGCSAPLCCLSPKRFFCASGDDLVGVQAVKAFPYIWMCELLAHEEV